MKTALLDLNILTALLWPAHEHHDTAHRWFHARGLVSDTAVCACNRRVPAALRVGRVRADSFELAVTASSFEEARAIVRQVDEARWALEVHRTSHPRASSVDFARRLAQALDPRRD